MPDEDTGTEDSATEDQDLQADELGPAGKAALDRERDARRKAEQERDMFRFLMANPHLSEEDLKGVPKGRWDYFAERLKSEASSSSSAESKSGETKTEGTVPDTERAAMASFGEKAGGTSGASAPAIISFADAQKLPWEQRRELLRQGLVEGFGPTT